MSTPSRQRTFITKHTTLTSRVRAYALSDALEIEERVYNLQRRRVLFDEVQLLTLHRRRRWALITVLLLTTVSFVALAAMFFNEGAAAAGWVCGALGLLFLLLSGLHVALPAHILTVASRRNKEQIHFGFREGRPRKWFAQLQRSIREAQNAAAEEVARQNAAVSRMASMAGPLPMPPTTVPTPPAAPVVSTVAPPASAPTSPAAPVAPTAPLNPAAQEATPSVQPTVESPASPLPPPEIMPPKG